MHGEKDPTQAISTCPFCNSSVKQTETFCPNCKQTILPDQGRPHPRKTPGRGERYREYGPKDTLISPDMPLIAKAGKRDKDKKNKIKVKDEFVSEEFRMCSDPKNKKRTNDDIHRENVMKSCLDLAIDG